MTTQDSGAMRPGRAAGLVLIGIAVIAAVLGVITLIEDGDGGNGGGAQPPATTTTANPPGGTAPPGTGTPPPPGTAPGTGTNPPPGPPTTGQPPANPPTQGPPQPQPPAPNPREVPVRVLNNSKVSGLAARAAEDFRADGWTVAETGNYSEGQGVLPTSTAYFRPGTAEESAARALAAKFNLQVAARFPGIASFDDGVIVIVTRDYGSK